MKQIGAITSDRRLMFSSYNGNHSLADLLPGGEQALGPKSCLAWILLEESDGRVLVVHQGTPPTLKWYPDQDTAKVALELQYA